MYKNLFKNVGCSFSKNQLLNVKLTRHQTDFCYHSGENGYFGFRPKVQALRESMLIMIMRSLILIESFTDNKNHTLKRKLPKLIFLF